MDIALSPALLGFVVAATITPGPNNIMVMTSGANFGFGRTVPHLLGVSAGVLAVVLLVGVGLMALLDRVPMLKPALEVASTVYLLWLAWKIAQARPPSEGSSKTAPLTFMQAAMFQWVNPKIWASGFSALTLFASDRAFAAVAVVALALAAAGLGANALWAWMGTALRHWLRPGQRLRIFNGAMALLLVASLYLALR